MSEGRHTCFTRVFTGARWDAGGHPCSKPGTLEYGGKYAAAFEKLYASTPKAVFAAVAYSFASLLEEGRQENAVPLFLNEWRVLHQNGIVQQTPPRRPRA